MAPRTTHVKVSILFYFAAIAVMYFLGLRPNYKRDSLWLIMGFLLVLYGAGFPDIDQLFKKVFDHRDWFTHSAILPVVLIIYATFTSDISQDPSNVNIVALPLLGFFSLGVSSHLFMDWLPTWDPQEDGTFQFKDIGYGVKWTIQGLSGEELVQHFTGTYLIHLPWKTDEGRSTLTKTKTRAYLIINGLILIAATAFSFYVYIERLGSLAI